MGERHCRYCQRSFEPSKFQPLQAVCTEPSCQRRRQADWHSKNRERDPDYREDCRKSCQKWRAEHPDYWQRYRSKHPESVERNRQQQRRRDRASRLADLANNHSALDLKRSGAEIWMVGCQPADLANNNLASAKILIFQTVAHAWSATPASCKQQPVGEMAAPGA
jgi:hypothetical protein